RAETQSMDFRAGGYWLYAMIGPEGEQHWGRADYLAIQPEVAFTLKDSFSDEGGVVNPGAPQATWETRFTEEDNRTRVNITLRFEDPEDLEKLVEMGFKEGFTASMENLDELLPRLDK